MLIDRRSLLKQKAALPLTSMAPLFWPILPISVTCYRSPDFAVKGVKMK
jgi:hypothetical protein